MAAFSTLLSQAQQLCEQRGVRMTSHRSLVYRLLLEHKQAITAYDLLEQLKQIEPQAKPPTVYRALDFLLAQGFVHKIESISSFIACHHIACQHHCSQLLICDDCGTVTECDSHDAVALLSRISAEYGFKLKHHIIETHGSCQRCQAGAIC